MKLRILHTNDIHSNYENFARIAAKINGLKDRNTIILDAGDFADFKRLELQGTNGLAALDLLESAGYDAIAIGNNETFNGLDTLTNMAVNTEVSFLSCNLHKDDLSPIEGIKRSIILNKDGMRILVIGISPDLGIFYSLSNIGIKDYKEALKEEIHKNKNQYDICVLLSHLGLREDREIAGEINDIDIIIGGHSHDLMKEPEIINDTIIHMSGAYGEYLGLLEVEFDTVNISVVEAENINIQNTECSHQIIEILKRNKEIAIDNLSQPLYTIDKNLWHDVIEENPISNLLADALKDVLKTDIGLINSGVINGGIRKGVVNKKKLLEICPSPLNPTYFEIQGRYLIEALQNSLDADFCMQDGRGAGFRGKYLGRLHVSGVRIEHNNRKINSISINGEKLDEDRWYSVAASDYIQRGTGYMSLSNNRNEKYNPEYLRDTLREYISKEEFVDRAFIDRWILK